MPEDSELAQSHSDGGSDDGSGPESAQLPEQSNERTPVLPVKLSQKKLQKLKEEYQRRGIVYISRIPPHLKPQKLRQLLEPYGEIGRVYLAPEDARLRRQRMEKGSNSGKNFTEGWVEFEDKQVAKDTVALLNGQPMGGKRRSAYFYDLWNLRYLPKFKWDHLTEEINYQKAIRDQRLAVEVAAAKRERDFYLAQVDASKAHAAMAERRQQRASSGATSTAQEAEGGKGKEGGAADVQAPRPGVRKYGQRKAKADPVSDAGAPALSGALLRQLAGRKRPLVSV